MKVLASLSILLALLAVSQATAETRSIPKYRGNKARSAAKANCIRSVEDNSYRRCRLELRSTSRLGYNQRLHRNRRRYFRGRIHSQRVEWRDSFFIAPFSNLTEEMSDRLCEVFQIRSGAKLTIREHMLCSDGFGSQFQVCAKMPVMLKQNVRQSSRLFCFHNASIIPSLAMLSSPVGETTRER
jgi:hypothetical protein